jgi:hypothetical protein
MKKTPIFKMSRNDWEAVDLEQQRSLKAILNTLCITRRRRWKKEEWRVMQSAVREIFGALQRILVIMPREEIIQGGKTKRRKGE